jgi:hypothetical protein
METLKEQYIVVYQLEARTEDYKDFPKIKLTSIQRAKRNRHVRVIVRHAVFLFHCKCKWQQDQEQKSHRHERCSKKAFHFVVI